MAGVFLYAFFTYTLTYLLIFTHTHIYIQEWDVFIGSYVFCCFVGCANLTYEVVACAGDVLECVGGSDKLDRV